jgi:hypothetical protein
MNQETIVNEHGEKIHIRIIGKEISIHHEDASDEFIPVSEFLCDTIISKEELLGIFHTIKKMVREEIMKHYEGIA